MLLSSHRCRVPRYASLNPPDVPVAHGIPFASEQCSTNGSSVSISLKYVFRCTADLDSEHCCILALRRTGGLRPHFLDVCKPDFTRQTGMGFMGYMYTREVCTGYVHSLFLVVRKSTYTVRIAFSRDEHDINDSLESWM